MDGQQPIYNDEYLSITVKTDGVYVETFQKGFSLDKLFAIFSSHPEIEILNLTLLKDSLSGAPRSPAKFGRLKERIAIELQNGGLRADMVLNIPQEELEMDKRDALVREIAAKLKEKGIVYGIKNDVLSSQLTPGKSFVIAEGTPPQNGLDSVCKMYELQEAKPEVREDQSVNFYELRLINRVMAGEWLGERIDATHGAPGKNVMGEEIKASDGKNIPMLYDKNTVNEYYENGKTTLYSKVNGAVIYADARISVLNHLEINGDVDFKTGSIDFNGYVTIKGTVADGFSVHATRDIEINGQMGLGNIKDIVSDKGSIFIKGGVASKGKVEIRAAKNIFVKFIDNATVECGESMHIGFYCINSNITAREVIMDSTNGQIIGGTINAEIRVIAPIIGSEMEKKTMVQVAGFNRNELLQEQDEIMIEMVKIKGEQQKAKLILKQLEEKGQLEPAQRKEYNDNFETIVSSRERMKELEDRRKNIIGYLKTKGSGEIAVTKKIYPNCSITICNITMDIIKTNLAVSYYVQDGELKQTT